MIRASSFMRSFGSCADVWRLATIKSVTRCTSVALSRLWKGIGLDSQLNVEAPGLLVQERNDVTGGIQRFPAHRVRCQLAVGRVIVLAPTVAEALQGNIAGRQCWPQRVHRR